MDSFGLNHTLGSTDIAVNWLEREWDRNKDKYPYAEDQEEAIPAPFDGNIGLVSKAEEKFDQGNRVVADGVPGSMRRK